MNELICFEDIAEAVEGLKVQPVTMNTGTRYASVAAILRKVHRAGERESELEDVQILFIRRAERHNDPWSGHVAFPGGHVDASDASLMHTAVRETKEEIGLDLDKHGQLLGPLGVTRPQTKPDGSIAMVVSSFAFSVFGDYELKLNDEVDEVIWTSMNDLVTGKLQTSVRKTIGGIEKNYPAFDLGGPILWGMTYYMLNVLLKVIYPSGQSASA